MSGARLAYVGYVVMDWGYLPPLGSGKTDTGMGVSAWMWGMFGKRLSAFGAKGMLSTSCDLPWFSELALM